MSWQIFSLEHIINSNLNHDNCHINCTSHGMGNVSQEWSYANNLPSMPSNANNIDNGVYLNVGANNVSVFNDQVIRENDHVFSRNKAKDFDDLNTPYVRNLDLERPDVYVERKGQFYKADDMSEKEHQRRSKYNQDVFDDAMPDIPKSFSRSLQGDICKANTQRNMAGDGSTIKNW